MDSPMKDRGGAPMSRRASRRLVRRRARALLGWRAQRSVEPAARLSRVADGCFHAGEVVHGVRTWRRSAAVLRSVADVDQTVASPHPAPGRRRAGTFTTQTALLTEQGWGVCGAGPREKRCWFGG
ncbi:hypothetical protein QYE76_048814 [Lolium multiflorum]|uniref:Uncharacterized protein n=1 Tax=Lolium multiflorum TaxID=4521 RepID=A0AAD8WHQ7_LOLMU|nr:hypothetical protein QYE76_048814 [Lolium multiflorum]